jgi:para-nitrobenzyl esterase
MGAAFIAFADTGDPNHKGIPKWEPYTFPQRATRVFNSPSKLVNDPRTLERRLFEKVPFIQQGT